MMMEQLPDGNWATTPVYVGTNPRPACAEHDWSDGTVEEAPAHLNGMTHIRMQTCAVCGWHRALLTKGGPARNNVVRALEENR